MHCTIAALRTKLAPTTSSRLSRATASQHRWHPIRALQLLAGLLLAASLGSVAHAQPLQVTVPLADESDAFVHPESCGAAGTVSTYYVAAEFRPSVTGIYTVYTAGNTGVENHVSDPFLLVYDAPFDPAAPLVNCLYSNDNVPPGLESLLTLTLSSDAIYTAIITTAASEIGLVEFHGDGVGVLEPIVSVRNAFTSAPTSTGGTLTVQLSDTDDARWLALPSGAAAPTSSQVALGQDATGEPVATSGGVLVDVQGGVTTPIAGLAANTLYDFYVVAYNGGVGSGVHKTTLMTTAAGVTAPTLTSSVPSSGATDAAAGSNIVLTFDLPVSFGTGVIEIDDVGDAVSAWQIDVESPGSSLVLSGENMILTITPVTPLVAGSTYRVFIPNTALLGDNAPFAGLAGDDLEFTTVAALPADTSPDEFTFPAQTGVPTTTARRSTIIVSGITTPTPIAITDGDGSFTINGGPAQSTGTVNNGDEVILSLLTSGDFNQTSSTTLTIGDVSAEFSVTTGDANPIITATSFTGLEGDCLAGGVRLSFGDDFNDDGTLDESERESARNLYVCNGVNILVTSRTLGPNPLICPNGGVELTMGVPQIDRSDIEPLADIAQNPVVVSNICNGLKSLVDVEGFEGDDECPAGGVRIITWLDESGEGDLTEGEDDISQKVCNGVNALVQMTTLLTDSAACPRGGTLVTVGTDRDADGSLDPDEVTATAKLCNDAHSLVDTKVLAPNASECPTGGVEINSGADTNSNSALDTDEIIKSRKLCNAIPAVSRTVELGPDADVCPWGGSRLESGLDADGDHALSDAEVSASALVCDGSNISIRTVTLEPGSEECAAGGSVLESGVDSDGDGKLSNSEVSTRQALCLPPQLLFETTAVKVNDKACPHGGLRVTSGHDDGKSSGTAGDGKLQDGEVELDKAVCLAPTNVLVSGGSGSCSATPGHRGSTGLLWTALLGLATVVVRRRRRTLGRNN